MRWTVVSVLGSLLLGGCGELLPDEDEPKESVDPKDALPESLKSLEPGLPPMVVLGDVDDDADVDRDDEAALQSGIASELACAAAGDLTMDGVVDGADLELFAQMIGDAERVEVPMLFAQPKLPCGYASLLVAATPDARPGQTLRLRFFGGIDANQVSVTVSGVPAEWWVSAADALSVLVPDVVAPTDTLVLVLGLPNGLSYVYAPRLLVGFEAMLPEEGTPAKPYGEEIDEPVCPQRGQGCEALILDFSEKTRIEFDADHLPPLFEALGCTARWVTPDLVPIPTPLLTYRNALGIIQVMPPSAAKVQAAAAKNQQEWQNVWDALKAHRDAVRAGKDLAFVMVNGHGSDAFDCGTLGAGFDSGTSLHRRFLHRDNYRASRRNVCTHVAHDMTCYGSLTPKAIEELNNSGDALCGTKAALDHVQHAGYDANVSSSAVPSGTCSNGEAASRMDEVASVLQAEIDARAAEGAGAPAAGDYERLGQRFRNETYTRGPAAYIDSGYAECAPDEHVSTH